MEILFDPEEKITCPYNPAHQIRRYRMAVHLVKCKKNYPEAKLVACDFNTTHKVPEPELQYHCENCPDRRAIEIGLYEEEGVDINKIPVVKVEIPDGGESWDDLDVPTYNPREYCEKNEILRHLDVESKSKRKNFRISERQRIQNIMSSPSSTSSRVESENSRSYPSSTNQRQRVLPEPRTAVKNNVNEPIETPDSIAEIMKRIKFPTNPVVPQ